MLSFLANGVKPPAWAINCRTVVCALSEYVPGLATSPVIKARLLRISMTVTVTCGLVRKPLSFSATRSWICSGVIPLTFTSLISGSEMFPSVRTTTVCETSGSFQTVTRITSESPTMYPGGTDSGGFTSAAVLLASSDDAASEDFKLTACVWVWAARLHAPAIKNIATAPSINFLCENMYLLHFSTVVHLEQTTEIIAVHYLAPLPNRMTLTVSKMTARSNEMERCLI